MTNQSSPITPPPELVEQWYVTADNASEDVIVGVANRAAQWSADQELEACCEWLQDPELNVDTYKLRAARRPSAQSLKEQALESVKRFEKSGEFFSYQMRELEFIRKALEQLDD